MTNDQFLDNEKLRGNTIYRCTHCDFRGYGAATMYHESHHKDHVTYNEDWPSIKVKKLKEMSHRGEGQGYFQGM